MLEKLNDNTVHECKKEQALREKDISKGWSISSGYILEMLKGHDIQKFPILGLQKIRFTDA